MCRRAIADIDPLGFRNATRARFARRHDDEPGALVDRRIGDLELGIGEGDRAVLVARRNHVLGRNWLADPRGRIAGGHFGEPAPDRTTFRLPLGQRLAQRGAQGILVKRVNVGRHDQPVALRIAHLHPVRGIAQRVALLPAAGCGLAGTGRAQRFCPRNQRDPDLARANPIGGLVQQQDRAIAVRPLGLDQFSICRTKLFSNRPARVGNLRKGDLLDHADPVCLRQQRYTGIRLGRAQRIGHQGNRIAPLQRVLRTIIDLSDANDDGQQVGIHRINPCAI